MKPQHSLRDHIRVPIPQTGGGLQYLTVSRDDLVKIREIVPDKSASHEHRMEIGLFPRYYYIVVRKESITFRLCHRHYRIIIEFSR